MHILLTNDDGIYAPGLAALETELQTLGDLTIVAPATEQSGVGHSITFLTPLIVQEVYDGDRQRGWAVEGSPADCVKLGVSEFCPERPSLVVSGINGGSNAGINVLYSGTVAAAIEGAFFGITSVAVSLEFDDHADYRRAAQLATAIIRQILAQKGPQPQLYNLNIPLAALRGPTEVCIVPMGVVPYGERYLKRQDPKGRTYYWATGDPPPQPTDHATDLSVMHAGKISLSPLQFDMTAFQACEQMQPWSFTLPPEEA